MRKKERIGRGFEVVPHTADVGLRLRGGTFAELLENGARGLNHLLWRQSGASNAPAKSLSLYLRSNSRESLLVDWLQELLYYFSVKKMLFSEVRMKRTGDFFLEADVAARPFDPQKHPPLREVKAVTYHDLKVKQEKGLWSAEVICDI